MRSRSESTDDIFIEIKWTIHPVKKNLKLSVLVIIFLVTICISIYISFDSLLLSFLSAVFLFSSLSSFFFPTTYIFHEKGIIVKNAFREFSKEWNSYKRYYIDKNGIFLSPFPHRTRLENFRGLYIKFDNNKEQVISYIKSKIGSISTEI